MKLNNILISGGAGFIGSNLALKLIADGFHISVLDNLSPQIHGDNADNSPLYQSIKNKVHFIRGDVSLRGDWLKALENQDAIIHFAAETGTGQSMYEVEKYNRVNILGTALLWDVLANCKHTIQKVVIASSRAIYGEGKYHCKNDGIVFPYPRTDEYMANGDFKVKCPFCQKNVKVMSTTEDSKVHPISVYGLTKQTQEEMSMIIGKSLNIPVVALRYQNVYGPGQSLSNPYTGILSIFSTRIRNDNEILIFEDGEESRDFVFIDDVVEATILGLLHPLANFESFNVGSGERITVLSVAKILRDKFISDVDIKVTGNYRLGDIRNNYADISKIKSKLGFKPTITFDEGISRFVSWVNKQKIGPDKYHQSIEIMKEKGLYKC